MSGLWWEDAARAESRIGVYDGPDPDRPTRLELLREEQDDDEPPPDEPEDDPWAS